MKKTVRVVYEIEVDIDDKTLDSLPVCDHMKDALYKMIGVSYLRGKSMDMYLVPLDDCTVRCRLVLDEIIK